MLTPESSASTTSGVAAVEGGEWLTRTDLDVMRTYMGAVAVADESLPAVAHVHEKIASRLVAVHPSPVSRRLPLKHERPRIVFSQEDGGDSLPCWLSEVRYYATADKQALAPLQHMMSDASEHVSESELSV